MAAARFRRKSPSALQCLAGTAPVIYQSGQIHKLYLRRHCNKLLPHLAAKYVDREVVLGRQLFPRPHRPHSAHRQDNGENDPALEELKDEAGNDCDS
jgi:hypothetical protein